MKSFLFGVVLGFIIIAGWKLLCQLDAAQTRSARSKAVTTQDQATIEGCQYFVFKIKYPRYVLTHKGNCTNALHITVLPK